jgi:hypothetical protein
VVMREAVAEGAEEDGAVGRDAIRLPGLLER